MSDVSGETGKETSEGFPEIADNLSDRKKLPNTTESSMVIASWEMSAANTP